MISLTEVLDLVETGQTSSADAEVLRQALAHYELVLQLLRSELAETTRKLEDTMAALRTEAESQGIAL